MTTVDRARYLAGVDIRILGPIEVIAAGEAVPLGGSRERALLALFALAPGQPISTDRLIDSLWGEDLPANPANALQALVSRLRRTIGADAVVTRPPGYMLDMPPEAVDAMRFRSLVDSAHAEDDAELRAGRFREALDLWRGPALAEFPYAEFALREAASLEELRLIAVEGRISADLAAGAGGELVPELEDLIAAHPLRESLRASLMLALYRAGRQAEALRAYAATRQELGEELGIEPGPELRALEEAILMQDPTLSTTQRRQSLVSAVPSLPARLASFVGRQAEMEEVAAAFTTSRLVTLTGAGGVGKTTLAIEVARSVGNRYPDGVWIVELARITDPALVPDALVAGLRLDHVGNLGGGREAVPLETVVEYLRDRKSLIILDNCEHVIEGAAASLETILLACEDVDVLATSRDRLGIPGELLWRVPSLDVLDDGPFSDAVALFVDRARAVNPAFEPDESSLATVVEICRKVDGIPLAIELAAARVRALPVAEIAQRLDAGIGILSGGARGGDARQQTLRATIDWSYELLGERERALFAKLAVFHGTFRLDAVEAVAALEGGGDVAVLDTMERLVDSSVVSLAVGDGTARYRLLETLRLYAAERLVEIGAWDATMGRLLDYLTLTLADSEQALQGPEQLTWLDRIETDHDTIRGALDWGEVNAPAAALRLAGSLGWFWYLRGSGAEARERLGRLLTAAGDTADARTRGDAYFFLSLHDPQPERGREGFEAARQAYVDAGHEPGVANSVAMLAAWGFDREESIRLLDEASELSVRVGYDWGVALIRFLQAGVAAVGNDTVGASRLAQEATERFAAVGDSWGQGYSLYTLGTALRAMGDYEGSERALREALRHARPMRLRREMAPVISELASIATMRSDYETAAELLDEAFAFADEVPFAGSQGMVRNAKGRLARLQDDLDEARRLHQSALGLYQEAEAHGGMAFSHSCLGFTEEMAGNLDAARANHLAALEHASATNDVFATALAFEGLGATLIASGAPGRGVELLSAGLAARARVGTPLASGERLDVDRAFASAADSLRADELAAAVAHGESLDLDAAIAVAKQLG